MICDKGAVEKIFLRVLSFSSVSITERLFCALLDPLIQTKCLLELRGVCENQVVDCMMHLIGCDVQ